MSETFEGNFSFTPEQNRPRKLMKINPGIGKARHAELCYSVTRSACLEL